MAITTEAQRWSMLGAASGIGRNIVFNPNSSGLVSIEKITILKHYGGISWDNPTPVVGSLLSMNDRMINYGGFR